MKYLPNRVRGKFQLFLIGLLVATLIFACQRTSGDLPSNIESSADCRTIEHVLGEVCVPVEPQRIISLEHLTFGDALALGVQPVGTGTAERPIIPEYLGDYYSNQAEFLGSSGPNLEKVVQLTPDLILGIEHVGEPIFQQLSQIAPTTLGDWRGYPSWREHFEFVADVLGKEDEAAQVWDKYDQKVKGVQTALGDQMQDIEVSVIYAWVGAGMTIDAENSFAGSILADVGFRRPESQAAVDTGTIRISEERITDIDGDVLFVSVFDSDSEKVLAEWQQKPLWNQLKAVQSDQVYVVNGDIWRGGNPIAANLVLDELLQILDSDLAT